MLLEGRVAIYAAWVVVSLLSVVMFSMSAKELAPTERKEPASVTAPDDDPTPKSHRAARTGIPNRLDRILIDTSEAKHILTAVDQIDRLIR